MCRTVLVKGMPMKRFKKFKIDFMFTIYNKVTWGSLIINVLFFYYIFFCISGLLVFFFPFLFLLFIKAYRFRFFHPLTIYLSLIVILLLLLVLLLLLFLLILC